MREEIPSSGNLKDYGLHQVLAYLNKEHKNGVLTLINKNIRKSIYIEDGYVVCVTSNQDESRLGKLLIKAGKISHVQRDESLKLSKQTRKRQGITLIELGYLLPEELFHELENQVRERILNLFLWEDGMFNFKENFFFPEAVKIKVDIDSLIREGLIRKEIDGKEADNSYVQKANELYANIDNLSYYDVLEINMKDSLTEIKKAYLKKAKEFHPDRYGDLSDSKTKNKLTEIFTFINKAYNTLSDELKRDEYNAYLFKKVSKKVPRDKAEEYFRRGIAEIKRGNFWGASDFLRNATRMKPEKANCWAYLSLALSNIPGRNKETEETILKAIELAPQEANYYVHLGKIYLKMGMKTRAEQQFQAALSWDPTIKTAKRELERLKGKK